MPRPALRKDEGTLTDQALSRIRRDVLIGELGPASKLRIRELAERYDLGVTPIREALAKLGAEGLVIPISNRGFMVPALSRDDLLDITTARCTVEAEALRRSMKRGTRDWEVGIQLAQDAFFKQIKKHIKLGSRILDESDHTLDALHLAYHTSLIAACGSPRLIMLHRHLYHQAFRYRAIGMKRVLHTSSFFEEHKALTKVVLSRHARPAVAMLTEHLELTCRIAYPDS